MKIEWRSSAGTRRAVRRTLRAEVWRLGGDMARAALISGLIVTTCFSLARRILPDLGTPWLPALAVCALGPVIQWLLMLSATLVPARVGYTATAEGIRIAGAKARFVKWKEISGWNLAPSDLVSGETTLLLATKRGVRGHSLPDGPERERLVELIAAQVRRDEALRLPRPRRSPVYNDWLYPWTLAVGAGLGLLAAGSLEHLSGYLGLACLAVMLAGPGTAAALLLPAMRRRSPAERFAPALLLNLLALSMACWIVALHAVRALGAPRLGP